MDIISVNDLSTLVLLVLPGFVATKVFDLLVPGERKDASRQAFDALAYGVMNLGLWFVPLNHYILDRRDNLLLFYGSFVLMLVVTPIALACLARFVLTHPTMRPVVRHPSPTAWDYFFGLRRRAWVLARLKSGKIIGGWYGLNSFASSYPDRDIYLETVWKVDEYGRFACPQERSLGAIIAMDECELIEFFVEEVQDGTAVNS